MNFPPIPLYSNNNNNNTTADNDLCAICLENLSAETTHTLRECNHTFHSSCLIEALRANKKCPLCRGQSQQGKIPHSGVILRQIIAYSKSKKNTNKRLKELIHKYEIAREACKSSAKKYREFNKEHKNTLARLRRLKHEKWKTMRTFWHLKRIVANLPILPVNK